MRADLTARLGRGQDPQDPPGLSGAVAESSAGPGRVVRQAEYYPLAF